MKSWNVWAIRIGLTLCLGLCAGCFIEVGNPGQQSNVSTQFRIDYGSGALAKATADSGSGTVHITSLQVGFLEMEYFSLGDTAEHPLWNNDSSSGVDVDFSGIAGPDSLPTVSIPSQVFTKVLVELTTPAPTTPSDFNPTYVQGYVKTTDSIPFLFPIPSLNQFNLVYGAATVSTWQRSGSYNIEILFSLPRWLDSIDLSQAQSSLDSSGRPVLLLDSLHNAAVYLKLKSNFLKAFNSDSTYLGVD